MANEGSVSVGTSAASVVQPSPGQTLLLNNNGSSAIFVGTDSSVTTSNGFSLATTAPGNVLRIDYGVEATVDLWWAISAGTAQSLHWVLVNTHV